jgi:signal transduction histidine kinase
VVIEELLVDNHPVPRDPAGKIPLRIPPGQNRFEFHFTGLSFVVPEKVRFKYRLEGLETEWVDGDTKRQVNYSYIAPGDYTFRVIACNNDGKWNEEGASLSFTLLPHFWQTWWFLALAGALALAAAGGVVWYSMHRRMLRKLERLERQRAIERERERIAKDIHDDLGASLTRITMLSQSAQGNLDDPARAAANLDRIYGTARELTRAMDEIVWAVNPKHDTLDSLASYLGRFAQDFLGAARVRCRLDVPVQLPAWHLSAEVRHNLFLAFKEALHNVVKHAGASEVRVSLLLQPPGFALAVEDNGCGYAALPPGAELPADPERLAHGNGLLNMRRRLEEIRGQCDIDSRSGGGTRVRLTIPISGQSTSPGSPRDQRVSAKRSGQSVVKTDDNAGDRIGVE